jgi:hypothetical protein
VRENSLEQVSKVSMLMEEEETTHQRGLVGTPACATAARAAKLRAENMVKVWVGDQVGWLWVRRCDN